jgi:Putative zinc-finger
MNPDHAIYADWDSAYVLGALSPAERREFEEHLETCETCRRSVAELAPMPGLLARLSPERAAALVDDPDAAPAPAPRDELLAAVRREDRRLRARRNRVWLTAAVAAAVLALVVIAVPLTVVRPGAGTESVAFEAVADVPLTATATLITTEWGTRIELDCRYAGDGASDAPSDGWPYALVVVDRDGERSEVSSWRASPGSVARLAAGTAVDLDDIVSLEIRAVGSGDVLMRGTSG